MRDERSTNEPSMAPREIASMPMVPLPAQRSRKRPALTFRARRRNIDSLTFRAETEEFIFSMFVKSSPSYRPSVTCSSEVIFGRFIFSQGFFVFGRSPGRGGGILPSDADERFLKKRRLPSCEPPLDGPPDCDPRFLPN